MKALVVRPAAVLAAQRAPLHEVDLLVLVLADVCDHNVAVRAVEREAPRIAQADREHLGLLPGGVEAQDLAQQPLRVLRVAERIAAAPAVARAGVEPSIRAKLELTAVVVRIGAVFDTDELAARRELLDVDVAVPARVIDVEAL